jgi:hypothetical protein
VPQLCSLYVLRLAHTFAPHYSLNTLTSTRSVPVISENATTFYSPTNTLPPYILQCSQISPHAHPPDKPPPNMPIWSTQPFKALYGLFFLTKVPILLPWSLIRYAPKSSRPTPNIPLRVCVVNAICRELFKYYTATRSTGVASVTADHKRAGERFALATPADTSLFTGVLTLGTTKPVAVGGIWYPSPLGKRGRRVKGGDDGFERESGI